MTRTGSPKGSVQSLWHGGWRPWKLGWVLSGVRGVCMWSPQCFHSFSREKQGFVVRILVFLHPLALASTKHPSLLCAQADRHS